MNVKKTASQVIARADSLNQQNSAHIEKVKKKIISMFKRKSAIVEGLEAADKTMSFGEIQAFAKAYSDQVDENDDEETLTKKTKLKSALLSLDAITETVANLEKEVSIFRTTHDQAMASLNNKILKIRDLMGSLEAVQNQVGYITALIEGKRINYERKRNVLMQERQGVLKDKSITEHSRKAMISELDRRITVIKEMYEHELSICQEQLDLYKKNVIVKKDLIAVGLLAEYETLMEQMKTATESDMSIIQSKIAAIKAEMIRKEIDDLKKTLVNATSAERLAIEERIDQLTRQIQEKIEKEGARAIGTKIVHTDVEGKMFFINQEGEKTYRLEPETSNEFILDIAIVILQYYRPKIKASQLELVQKSEEYELHVSDHSSDISLETMEDEIGDAANIKYLQQHMKKALVKGFTLSILRNPSDPVNFLVEFLRSYKQNLDKQTLKSNFISQLKTARVERARHIKGVDFSATSHATIRNNTPIREVECDEAFNELTTEEKFLAHYSSLACWHGGLIILFQTSVEAPIIFSMLLRVFLAESLHNLRNTAEEANIESEHFQALLLYTCGIFCHMGNYRGTIPYKFVPNLPEEIFYKILELSEAYTQDPDQMEQLWQKCHQQMYSLTPSNETFGIGANGISMYYTPNIDTEDIDLIKSWIDHKQIRTANCTVYKFEDKLGRTVFNIKAASSRMDNEEPYTIRRQIFKENVYKHGRGAYNLLIDKVIADLIDAQQYASLDIQKAMLEDYIDHFSSGNMIMHEEMVKKWLQTMNPKVELSLGFNKENRDPTGLMSEFVGFVGIKNTIIDDLYKNIVQFSEEIRSLLPWSSEFEKNIFLKPDFTALELLSYASSKFPDVLNIPDYQRVVATEGFKVVCLKNLMSNDESELLFLSDEDRGLMLNYQNKACIIQVGLKEIIGHGCGKLFMKKEDGTFNFDKTKVLNPVTKQLIETWYGHDQKYSSQFKEIGKSYEECRAECVALYLITHETVLKHLGYEGEEAEDICYIYWLNFIWTSLFKGTLSYNSEKRKWNMPLSRARYVITRMLIDKALGLITITDIGSDDKPNLLVQLDRNKLHTTGKSALEEFLIKVQTYKSLNNPKAAKTLFDFYSQVELEFDNRFERWRDIAVKNTGEKPMFVQPNTIIQGRDVNLKTYIANPSGFIESYTDRYNTDILDIIEKYWEYHMQQYNPE